MTINLTVIELSDETTDREVYLRGDLRADQPMHSARHLTRWMQSHPNFRITNISCYQQPSTSQSLRFHRTGEVI